MRSAITKREEITCISRGDISIDGIKFSYSFFEKTDIRYNNNQNIIIIFVIIIYKLFNYIKKNFLNFLKLKCYLKI